MQRRPLARCARTSLQNALRHELLLALTTLQLVCNLRARELVVQVRGGSSDGGAMPHDA